VRYVDTDGAKSVVAANEIHLPVGEPVRVELASADVIHSFWVPNLLGKRDLVPGVQNAVTFTPAQVGTWRGQCAEFCGLQHARMALYVVVESKDDFARWRSEQATEAGTSSDLGVEAGQAIFFARGCNICHAIRGTPANGQVGPDLTHLASRQWLAAGAVPMSREALGRWVTDPHAFKPGVHMPASRLDPGDSDKLSAFLESLK
jgi:cytochrome c oxidase subunit 2